ncbi:DUF4440 domain-containing protein [Kribbella ginsengisoli]|uniref:DUF4440 domain-containing protein n=1 Tax=Kribbella ginsengisoli TaxID=363865 RepID=A0ABP6XMH5_9ACTN
MSDENPQVLAELSAREPIFHRLELGTTRADFEAQTVDDYWEIGASGQRYDREFIWSVLERRYAEGAPDEWETDEFECRELAAGTYLLTYRLRQGARVTRRASVWRRSEGGWQAVYHQGTVV